MYTEARKAEQKSTTEQVLYNTELEQRGGENLGGGSRVEKT